TEAANATTAPANNVFAWSREADTVVWTVAPADVGQTMVFTLGTREPGMIIDRMLFTTDPTLVAAQLDALANSETDVVEQGASEDFVAFEAEAEKAKLINGAPTTWVRQSDGQASGAAALAIGGAGDNATAPHSFAQYQIRFAAAGDYHLFYRWRADEARTAGDTFTANSCWFSLPFAALSTPGDQSAVVRTEAANATTAPANNVFAWSREADTVVWTVAPADVGQTMVFTLGTREPGMIVDRLIFTTDPTRTAAQLDALPNTGTQAPAPELRSAVGSAALTTVTVTFTRPLAAASVTPGRFAASGGLTVTTAEVDAGDPRIVRLTTSAQTAGTAYTLTVTEVTDTTGTPIQPNSTIRFTAWRRAEGWATKELFFGVTGATVDDLKNAPAFLEGRPDRVEYVRGFGLDRDPVVDNYGARLTAYFQPATAGTQDFFLANDDEAELLLSSDTGEASLASLGIFPLSPHAFAETPSVTSGDLVAGQRYLMQGLLKQGGGDVYLRVGVRSSAASDVPPLLGGSRISTWLNPDLGQVTFTRQPTPATVAAGQRARFEVRVEGSGQPVYYQWEKDGTDIPNAIRPVYTTPVLAAADGGRNYRCRISVAGVDTLSQEALLTVSGNSPSPQQPYIGVSFVGGANIPGALLAEDVAGAVPQEHWNNLEGFTFDAVPLNDAAGAASPVTFSAAVLTEAWYSGTVTTGDADGILLQGLVTAGSPVEPVTLTFANVPFGRYQVLAYATGFNFSPAYEQDWSLAAGSSHATITGRAEVGLNWTANPAFRRITSTDPNSRATGNYVQFDDVSPAADGSLTLSVTWAGTGGNSHQPAINALQIVKVVAVAVPITVNAPVVQGETLVLTWSGGAGPFTVERRDTLTGAPAVVATTAERTATVPLSGTAGYLQVRDGN
ncbi:MAG: hypothetical protein J0L84_07335, partial [Verrucomicrobia bacterium]|nr:hypothetical protein [Verrucomicrobiota bacterium]